MVAQQAVRLIALTTAATRAVNADLGGELAAVLQPGQYRDQLPGGLVATSTGVSLSQPAEKRWCTVG